jgi:WD40 repeat protein
MQRPVDENGEQSSPQPQQAVRRGISRRSVLLGLLGLGGLAAAGITISAGPVSRWIQKQGYPPGLLFSSDDFGAVFDAAWSPDGQRMAFGGLASVTKYGYPGTIQIWDVFPRRHLLTLAIPTAPNGLFDLLLAWSPDGKYLFSASDGVDLATRSENSREVRIWDVETGKSLHSFPLSGKVWALNTRYLAIVVGPHWDENVIQVWDVANGHLVNTLKGPFVSSFPEDTLILSWAPDGRRLAIINGDGAGVVQIWDALAGTQLLAAQLPDSPPVLDVPTYPDDHYLVWSPNGRYLAAIRKTGPIDIFDTVKRQVVFTYKENGMAISTVAWSSGKQEYIAFSSTSVTGLSTVSVYEALTNKLVQTYKIDIPSLEYVSRLLWSPDGNYLAVAGGDRMRVWKLAV